MGEVTTPPTAFAATAVNLGTASSFSVLAALSMSAAGAGTIVSGDLGLSPGLAGSKTGTWTVGGSQYFGTGGLSEGAQADALTAFNTLAGQSSDGGWGTNPWSPVPGTWTIPLDTSFTGTITLNGDYDDVWVFQVGQDMTFSGSVILTGTAQPCNVFWQVGRDATIASGSTFVGTVIASRDVTVASGATVNGRIISLNGALTTDGNTISGPTCNTAPTPTLTPGPTSTTSSSSTSTTTSSGGTTVGPDLAAYIAPTTIESTRVDADSIFIRWGPYSGIDTFNIQYGLTNGEWLYSTNVIGFSTTINDLPPNQPIWFRIAVRDPLSIGPYGGVTFVGGPGLPNAGFALSENNILSQLFSFYLNWDDKKTAPPIVKKTSSALPVRLVIPAIHVDTHIQHVGITPQGEMEVPSNIVDVGWFKPGVRPGEKGSAVITGHVDGENGEAAVFSNLDTLKEGDTLYVEDDKGVSTTYVVRMLKTYDPGYAEEVFSSNDGAHLNLITCDGIWDEANKRFTKRLVVFADIVH